MNDDSYVEAFRVDAARRTPVSPDDELDRRVSRNALLSGAQAVTHRVAVFF
jgi:hypothetical protein